MDSTVTTSGFTVIEVKHKDTTQAATLNWWLEKIDDKKVKLTGLPVYVTKEHISNIFSRCGGIVNVELDPVNKVQRLPHYPRTPSTKGYQEAVVQFKKSSGSVAAMAMKYSNKYFLCTAGTKISPMVEVWKKDLITSYDIDTAKLAEECTEFMRKYDTEKAVEEKRNQKMADEPDEDGWITVTRTKFNHPPKAIKAHELKKLKKKKETQQLLHFYKNQVSDSKMQKIKELKAKFEEDKKRIQEMRKQRKFKPY